MALKPGGTLIYSPGVSIVIESARAGIIDVSEDIAQGSVSLRQNGSHTMNVVLNNVYRKYDGVFAPNDRFVVQLKRFRWLQIMSGYLDSVPYFSTYPKAISLRGQCSLKTLKNFPWDDGSEAAFALLHDRSSEERNEQDGGISKVVQRLFTEVVRWPEEKVHIGRIPSEWVDKFQTIYDRLQTDQIKAQPVLGTNPLVEGRTVPYMPFAGNSSLGGGAVPPGEGILFRDADMDVVLATIRQKESGNNYSAINRGDGIGDWATGAYQFVDSTWNNYKGYGRAYLAPPSVQDAKAAEYLYQCINKYGPSLFNVPVWWYYPRALTDPSWLDKIPAANEGNNKTIRQYANEWLVLYTKKYAEMRGGALPPTSSGTTGGGSGSSPQVTTSNVSGALYPIAQGVNSLSSKDMAWGGYSNGKIPSSAMSYAAGVGSGHPIAVESYTKMLEEASKVNMTNGFLNIRGSCYRSYDTQEEGYRKWPNSFAPPGKSNHGWGLAIDISVLVPSASNKKYPGMSKNDLYDTDEYKWLTANAWRYGWGHPVWARKGQPKAEPWHWEFFAFSNFRNGGTPTQEGYNPFDGANGLELTGGSPSQLFAAFQWWSGDHMNEIDPNSEVLWGYKALMNDSPVMEKIDSLLRVTNRVYCSAPNGDFISWFPDYWGEYGIAGRMDIETIELKDFAVMWGDEPLVTHQYVEGGVMSNSMGPLPSAVMSATQWYTSSGVVTMEMPGLLRALTNIQGDEYPWLSDPESFLRRFGARIDREKNTSIMGAQQEFWFALARFQHAWASQFNATAPMTFMPELFPGMLLRIPEFGVQFYVQEVTHSFSMQNDTGFSTDANIIAPSALDGSGFYLFNRAGLGRDPGSGGGGLGVKVM